MLYAVQRRRTLSYTVKEKRSDRDGGGRRGRDGDEPGGEWRREREREKDRHPMGARSFFVMIVILEPDQPRASGPAGLLLRSISYSSRSRPSGRYATLIPPFAGAIYTHRRTTPRCNPICMPRRDRPSVCPLRGLACNEQNHSDCMPCELQLREARFPIAEFAEKFPRSVALSLECISPLAGRGAILAQLNYKM